MITNLLNWTELNFGESPQDLLLTKNSNQGPWDGKRELCWKSKTINTFNNKELIEFATTNDWKLLDSISFFSDTLTQISFSKLKNDEYSLQLLNKNVLPKINSNFNRIFIFKTAWLAIEPGNSRETFENGFAAINSDGTELKIYHFWGE